MTSQIYCPSLTQYTRRKSRPVNIGGVMVGGEYPIRIQSMTTMDTMDTQGSIEQTLRMVDAGCEIVRITAPTTKDAKNLENIKQALRKSGCEVPLVADIHFMPAAAEIAATIVEKVRINPGNYADRKKFQVLEYTDESYQDELKRIEDRFSPLVDICKQHGTAMRIGTNHGSLSDRIMSRFGDTPLGMVESALEFIRICEKMDYKELVISMKSSNPQVMVQAYRLLVNKLDEEGLEPYPLHLGVTEAGEAEDGRIKSSVGIGALLEDGLGDTIRVSLTEEPEAEAPVAKRLVDRLHRKEAQQPIPELTKVPIHPFEYQRRPTQEVLNFGGEQVPRVMADFSLLDNILPENLSPIGHTYLPDTDKWEMSDLGADYVYIGDHSPGFMLPNGLKAVINYDTWLQAEDKTESYPYHRNLTQEQELHPHLNFIEISTDEDESDIWDFLNKNKNIVLVITSRNTHNVASLRRFVAEMMNRNLSTPTLIKLKIDSMDGDDPMLFPSTDAGSLLVDGIGDGIMLSPQKVLQSEQLKSLNSIAFGILQAARTRVTKTEYISCPSCGRTLFDLQETTAMIRQRTDHLKGVKIGIMGCIVNGPGEMADADFGYVGSAKGIITLYKGQEVVKRGVPSENALDELIDLIKANGRWVDP